MKSKTISLFFALALAFGFSVINSSPAQAGWPGGKVVHDAQDSGYNDAIRFTCDWNNPWGAAYTLALGQSSKSFCSDADGIHVPEGTQVFCNVVGPTWGVTSRTFDATGWHKIQDADNYNCFNQLD